MGDGNWKRQLTISWNLPGLVTVYFSSSGSGSYQQQHTQCNPKVSFGEGGVHADLTPTLCEVERLWDQAHIYQIITPSCSLNYRYLILVLYSYILSLPINYLNMMYNLVAIMANHM